LCFDPCLPSCSVDGNYKSVFFITYADAVVTPEMTLQADAIQRNRTADADCYNNPNGCNLYKAFASDTNATNVVNIEPSAIPPVNPINFTVPFVITFFNDIFQINGITTPLLKPNIYSQHAQNGPIISTDKKVQDYLKLWTFPKGIGE